MNKKLTYFFYFCLITGSLVYFLNYFSVSLPTIINNYLNDFLIIPIVLFISLHALKWSRNDKNYKLTLFVILYTCLLYSILFEFVFPKYLARYTKDFIDVFLYFASGIIFYFLQKNNS